MSVIKSEGLVVLCTISTNGEIKLWDILNFLGEEELEDTIELEDKVRPINMIRTTSRLTCLWYFICILINQCSFDEGGDRERVGHHTHNRESSTN
jgi:hypothetical protein